MAVEVRKPSKTKKKAAGKKPKKQPKPKPEEVTMFNIEKLGLRSGIGDLSSNWHHYVYGTEKGR
jgi:hypothetical protein